MYAMKRFFSGIRAYAPAFRLLFSARFAWFLLFPVAAVLLLFALGMWVTGWVGGSLHGLFADRLAALLADVAWLAWLNDAAGWLVWIVVRVAYFFLFSMFGGYLLLIVLSPVYSWLSERVERELTGRTYSPGVCGFLRDILRGVGIALRNLLLQTGVSILLFFFSFLPLVGWLSPLLMLLASAYFYGFSLLDYAVERRRLGVRDSVRYVNRRASEATGVGFVFSLALMVPFLNLFVCSFLSLAAVIDGAIVVNREED